MNQTGKSHWRKPLISVNDYSIGIEVLHHTENDEFFEEQYDALIKLINRIKNKFNGNNEKLTGFTFTGDPYESVKYNGNIVDKNIIGHSDISLTNAKSSTNPGPNAKLGGKPRDPGLKFDWRKIEDASIGLYFSKSFTIKEFKVIIADYKLTKSDTTTLQGFLNKEDSESITLEQIRALIDEGAIELFIDAKSYTNNPADPIDKFYNQLNDIGYFRGIGDSYSQIKSALQMFQIHFHVHLFPPETAGNEVNFGYLQPTPGYELYEEEIDGKKVYVNENFFLTKYQKKYYSQIYTLSIFIASALLRKNDIHNPF